MKRLLIIAIAIMGISLMSINVADARPHHGRHHYGLICGATQMAHFGITNARYRLAKAWLDFQRTTAQPGAVAVFDRPGRNSAGGRGGHVARIVSVNGPCSATVTDEKGTYERNICKRILAFVSPNSNVSPGEGNRKH